MKIGDNCQLKKTAQPQRWEWCFMWRIFCGLRSRGQPLTRVWGTVPKRQEEPRHIGSFATKPTEWEHRKITVNQSKPDIMSWGIWRVFLCREIPESDVEAVPLTRSWTLRGQYLGLPRPPEFPPVHGPRPAVTAGWRTTAASGADTAGAVLHPHGEPGERTPGASGEARDFRGDPGDFRGSPGLPGQPRGVAAGLHTKPTDALCVSCFRRRVQHLNTGETVFNPHKHNTIHCPGNEGVPRIQDFQL